MKRVKQATELVALAMVVVAAFVVANLHPEGVIKNAWAANYNCTDPFVPHCDADKPVGTDGCGNECGWGDPPYYCTGTESCCGGNPCPCGGESSLCKKDPDYSNKCDLGTYNCSIHISKGCRGGSCACGENICNDATAPCGKQTVQCSVSGCQGAFCGAPNSCGNEALCDDYRVCTLPGGC